MNRIKTAIIAVLTLLITVNISAQEPVDSTKYNNPYKINDELYQMFMRANRMRSNERCLAVGDSMLVRARELNDKKAECIALSVPITYYLGKNDSTKVREACAALREVSKRNDYPQYFFFSYSQEITELLRANDHITANELLTEMNNAAVEMHYPYGIASCHFLTGHLYLQRLNYVQAREQYLMAAKVIEENCPEQMPSSYYLSAAQMSGNLEDYEGMLKYAQKSIDSNVKGVSGSVLVNAIDSKTAACFFLMKRKEFEASHKEFEDAINKYGRNLRTASQTTPALWDYYSGNKEKALNTLLKQMEDNESSSKIVRDLIILIYEDQGRYKEALDFLKDIAKIDSQQKVKQSLIDAEIMEARLGVERLNAENAQLALEREKAKTHSTITILICAFAFLLAVLAFAFTKKKK